MAPPATPSPSPTPPYDRTPWDRARVLLEAQNLYASAEESAVRLKCLEMILSMLPAEAPKQSNFAEVVQTARRKMQG